MNRDLLIATALIMSERMKQLSNAIAVAAESIGGNGLSLHEHHEELKMHDAKAKAQLSVDCRGRKSDRRRERASRWR